MNINVYKKRVAPPTEMAEADSSILMWACFASSQGSPRPWCPYPGTDGTWWSSHAAWAWRASGRRLLRPAAASCGWRDARPAPGTTGTCGCTFCRRTTAPERVRWLADQAAAVASPDAGHATWTSAHAPSRPPELQTSSSMLHTCRLAPLLV
jgi:hypothetical protein